MIEGHRHDDYTLLGHKHAESDVTSLVVDLAGKAASVHTHAEADVTSLVADLGLKAPLASPSLTGVPISTTAAADVNTTQIATTAYVVGQASAVAPLVNGTAAVGTSLRYSRQDHVHPTDTSRAALASPSLTGTPLSTTAAVDNNSFQIATTAYVVGQAAAAAPTTVGTAAVGTSLRYARADHVHDLVGAWTAYTPTWTASTTNPVIGNGTITGSWVQFGKTIHFRATITPGSTTTFGAGAYSVSIPATSAAFEQLVTLVHAKGTTNIYSGVGRISASSTTVTRSLFVQGASSTLGWTPTVPATLASADVVTITGTYQAA